MMKSKRKLYFAAFAAVFAAFILTIGTTCFAADSDYQFDVETGTITKYQGTDTNVTIPTTIAGYPVKAIGKYAFNNCDTIISLTINSNIEDIGYWSFYGLENLRNLTINAGTLNFGDGAFAETGLENITMTCTDKLTFEGGISVKGVFQNCSNLKTIVFPYGTENIGDQMFLGANNLETVVLPDSVKTIGYNAFEKCPIKNINLPNSLIEIEKYAFCNCTSLEKITIPDSMNGALSLYLFSDCVNLKEIVIGNNITEIESGAFSDSGVEELTLPANLNKVSEYGFENTDNLKKLTIMNDEIDLGNSLKKLPTTCVVYCGADSNGLKAAIGAGLKYVIIDTTSAVSQPATPVAEVTAMLSSQPLSVNGNSVSVEAYNINGSNYFKLRDVASIINGTEKQFAISYNNSTNSISITSSSAYQAVGSELQKTGVKEIYATPSIAAISLDGSAVTAQAYNINGSNYFKLRDLAALLDFGIEYNQSTGTINIVTSEGYSEN